MQLQNQEHYDLILAGSSTTAKLDLSNFEGKHYNLSMEGGASITALDYMRQQGVYPSLILVETNSIGRMIDEAILESFDNPIKQFCRSNLKAFRMENKPGRYLAHLGNMIIDYTNHNIFHLELKKASEFRTALFDTIVSGHVKKNDDLKDTLIVSNHINNLKEVLKDFEANGARIILFEIPFDKQINNTEMPIFIDQSFQQLANEMNWKYINVDRSKEYRTGDGVHLNKEYRAVFVQYLFDQIASY